MNDDLPLLGIVDFIENHHQGLSEVRIGFAHPNVVVSFFYDLFGVGRVYYDLECCHYLIGVQGLNLLFLHYIIDQIKKISFRLPYTQNFLLNRII